MYTRTGKLEHISEQAHVQPDVNYPLFDQHVLMVLYILNLLVPQRKQWEFSSVCAAAQSHVNIR